MPQRFVFCSAGKYFQAAILVRADGQQIHVSAQRLPIIPAAAYSLADGPERSIVAYDERVKLS